MTMHSTKLYARRAAYVLCAGALGLGLFACSPSTEKPQTASGDSAIEMKSSGGDVEGLGTGFKFEQIKPMDYDASKVDLTPNANLVVDREGDGVVYNGVRYTYDTMSGATPLYVRTENPIMIDQDVKTSKMLWTVQPPLGIVEGEYYRVEKELTGGYMTETELVINGGNIVHVELDERGPDDYYEPKWAGETKRRSGYGFFQAHSRRTDETLVVTPNAFNYLEWQLLKYNSLNIPIEGVRGVSNSARYGFIPAIKGATDDPATNEVDETTTGLLQLVENPSGKYYASIALPVEQGVTARLQVIFEGDKIVEAEYDEIFADFEDEIADSSLKKYYRQSKLDSVDYEADVPEFRAFESALSSAMVSENSVGVSLPKYEDMKEYANFKMLAEKLQPTIDAYLADGVKHEVGNLLKEPADMPETTPIYYRTENLTATALPYLDKIKYDPESKTMTVTASVTNNASEAVEVKSEWFFLYNKIDGDKYENVGDPNVRTFTLEAGEARDITFEFSPVLETDLESVFKYDGPNKSYEELGKPSDFAK